ncbi:MAG TPA: 50S ribosomal protein L13 [Candidatus Paceibacterota bacterium]|jgi:large subunit ribosomal protein L13|nr:50S ribosomal protein L13 [Candidatus Paceibacterota bacterium]
MNYTVDATNKSLGRLASEVSALLIGKNKTDFSRNVLSGNTVTVINAGKLKVSPKKMLEKTYNRYSGYPGGLKQLSLAHVVEKKGHKEAISIAVKGMLPDNKLKKGMMKALTINE